MNQFKKISTGLTRIKPKINSNHNIYIHLEVGKENLRCMTAFLHSCIQVTSRSRATKERKTLPEFVTISIETLSVVERNDQT